MDSRKGLIKDMGVSIVGIPPGRVFVREVFYPSVASYEGVEVGCELYEVNFRKVSTFHTLEQLLRSMNETRPMTCSFLKVMSKH